MYYDDINVTKRKTITNGAKYDFYIYNMLSLEKKISNGKFGNMKITVENVPDSTNPKTSRLATLSAIELLRQICTKEVQIGT